MYTLEDIQAVDREVADAITAEFDRQSSHIELIASENWVSPAVGAVDHACREETQGEVVERIARACIEGYDVLAGRHEIAGLLVVGICELGELECKARETCGELDIGHLHDHRALGTFGEEFHQIRRIARYKSLAGLEVSDTVEACLAGVVEIDFLAVLGVVVET